MSDLHHSSIERLGGGGCELDGGYDANTSLAAVAMQMREAQAISVGGYRCKGEEVKYKTLGAKPLVLWGAIDARRATTRLGL